MDKGRTVEKRFRIWDNDLGCRMEVGDDSDGLDMIEVAAVETDGRKCQSVCFREEDAEAIAQAIVEVAHHIRSRSKKS